MKKIKIWYWRAITILIMLMVSACGATKVELPLDISEHIKAGNYQMPQYKADLVVAMNEDDENLRYMAAIHDLKLQLDIGEAYKNNLINVMDIMFANTSFTNKITPKNKTRENQETYILNADFKFVRVTIPRTRFGKTQAHVVTQYKLLDTKGDKLFSYTDYSFGAKANAILMSPAMNAFANGESGLASNAMQYNLITSITKISGIIQQYMNVSERKNVLKAISDHEQKLSNSAATYRTKLTNGDYQDKIKAASELQRNFVLLALTQDDVEKELLILTDQKLENKFAAVAAKQLCATLAITGKKRYLQTFQHISTNAKDNRLRNLGQKYYNYLLKSLCGTGDCSDETNET